MGDLRGKLVRAIVKTLARRLGVVVVAARDLGLAGAEHGQVHDRKLLTCETTHVPLVVDLARKVDVEVFGQSLACKVGLHSSPVVGA